jgi:hypothetical protein
MLGFGGHFATKSRAYSTTFSALRAARTTAMRRANATATQPEQLPPADDPDTVLVVGSWTYAGTGWRTTADAALALADAARPHQPTRSRSPVTRSATSSPRSYSLPCGAWTGDCTGRPGDDARQVGM